MGDSRHRLKVLFVCHNHPALYPGGTETYGLQLYEAMRSSEQVEPIFLARVGTPSAPRFRAHPGTPFGIFGEDDHQYWLFSEISDFDPLHLKLQRKALFTTFLRDFLLAHRPDVVHIQETLYLGLDLLTEIKNSLPDAAIVHSLHEYHPICHRDGVMVRTRNDDLCDHYSPRRCNECFPDIAPATFFMRKRFIESQLSLVDLFLAPSHFLMDRYVQWGLPQKKIRVNDHGHAAPAASREDSTRELRDRLGFFGQLNRYEGVLVLLNAMSILGGEQRSDAPNGRHGVHLRLHGANLEWETPGFQDELRELLDTSSNVTLVGRYEEAELPGLMTEIDWVVVPSLWWQDSPRAVQSAFQYGKPVICSDIGAMEEKVTHGVNGLHFRRGDPRSLAATIRLAAGSPELWSRLRDGIPPVRSIEEDSESLIDTYRQLRQSKAGRA